MNTHIPIHLACCREVEECMPTVFSAASNADSAIDFFCNEFFPSIVRSKKGTDMEDQLRGKVLDKTHGKGSFRLRSWLGVGFCKWKEPVLADEEKPNQRGWRKHS